MEDKQVPTKGIIVASNGEDEKVYDPVGEGVATPGRLPEPLTIARKLAEYIKMGLGKAAQTPKEIFDAIVKVSENTFELMLAVKDNTVKILVTVKEGAIKIIVKDLLNLTYIDKSFKPTFEITINNQDQVGEALEQTYWAALAMYQETQENGQEMENEDHADREVVSNTH